MISLALLADAIIGNVQEKAMKKYNASNNEVVLYSYLMGLGYLGVALILTRGLSPAIVVAQKVKANRLFSKKLHKTLCLYSFFSIL